MKELSKQYEPQKTEDDIYKMWEESGFFNPDNLEGEPYSVMMPPPNVTGVLHLGHAMENTLMDIMIRYQRMNGKKTLLLPGTDHAAVATQAKVEKILIGKGIKNPRKELGREKLIEEIRKYAEESKSTIISQIRKMGTSCDWSRLAYTFDEERSLAVNTVFTKMYNDGLIYRGHRVINWSVKGQSTCSDDELEHVERPAKLYTFKYSKDFPITIATTRPETKLGDTAVAVNPDDERYKKYIGQIFTVDIGAKNPLKIKIIADTEVEKDFGTGALGVTPAHSPIDFAMYERQKVAKDPIEIIQVIGKDGKMTEESGEDYNGLTVEDARAKFVNYLKKNNLLEKEEDIIQNVGMSDRFGDVVEAIPMTQWFIDVNKKIPEKNKSLKELMQEAVHTGHCGNKEQKINITPNRFEEAYFSWIDNLRDWCISRQVWWGHQIPVWYKDDEIFVGIKSPGDNWTQDPDTLDTWFSSGLWTFSTLGYPEETTDLETFHPTDWMQMGYELLFFWMARMILMSTYMLDEIPFKDVYIHGLVRDEKGNKFSKSSGNTLDPLDVIDEYGTDALRLSCISGISPGNDLKFYTKKVESGRNFTTKLWNVSRYITNATKENIELTKDTKLSSSDKWILTKLQKTVANVTTNVNKYNFSHANKILQSFTRDNFADWYVEIHKVKGNDAVLIHVYKTLLKLWHPFIPFVTETIWQKMFDENKILMITRWPTINKDIDLSAKDDFETIKIIITHIRNIRATYTVPATAEVDVTIITQNSSIIQENEDLIKKLSRTKTITIKTEDSKYKESATAIFGNDILYVHLSNIIDIEKERVRIDTEIVSAQKYIIEIQKRLSSEQFTKKAPPEIVQKEKDNLKDTELKIAELSECLKNLNV